MRRIFLFVILSILFTTCSLFEEDEVEKLDSAEFYETEDSQFPVLAVDETQTIFGFSQNMDQLFVKLPDGDQWLVEINNDGFPESMFVEKGQDNFLLLFSEFDGDKCNVAIINQDNFNTQYFYDIKFSGISHTSSVYAFLKDDLKSACETEGIESWWETYGEAVKKTAGPVLGGIGCGVSTLAAIGSGGVAIPIAALSCGSWGTSIAGDIVGEESTAGGALFKGGTVVGKYGEMVLKCAFQNWGSCAMSVCGEAGAIANLLNYGINKSQTNEAKNHLTAYTQTGGLAGTWKTEEIQVESGSYVSEYYFGLNAGRYTQTIKQTDSNSNTNMTSVSKLDFSYSVNGNTLTTTMTRVQIDMSGTQAGQSISQSFGPYTWEEFTNTIQYQNGGYTDKTSSIKFELKDDGQTLHLENGLVLNRVN